MIDGSEKRKRELGFELQSSQNSSRGVQKVHLRMACVGQKRGYINSVISGAYQMEPPSSISNNGNVGYRLGYSLPVTV